MVKDMRNTLQLVKNVNLEGNTVMVGDSKVRFDMPNVSLEAKKVTGVLLTTLVYHIQKRVKERNQTYIMLGVDYSYHNYRKFFFNVLSVLFRKQPVEALIISYDVYCDTAIVLGNAINEKGYQMYLGREGLYNEVMVLTRYWLDNYAQSEKYKELAYN